MTKYYPDSIVFCRLKIDYYLLKVIFTLLLAGFSWLFIVSCEEDPTTIGRDMLPGSDFVQISSIDTLSVFSYTHYNDSTRSDNPTYGYLGSVYNPYFGITTAEFVSQLRLAEPWYAEPFTVDSVKLFLRFENIIGDTSAVQELTISEIAEQIYTDVPYYTNTPVQLSGYDVATITLPSLKPDTINNIELRLPDDFGNYILRDTTQLFHSNSRPDFRAYFKGLYFRITSSSAPLLMMVNLTRTTGSYEYYNYIIVYYHNDSDTQLGYYFILDSKNPNAKFNRFIHDFDAAEPSKKINHINDGFKDTLSYLQSLRGVFTKITLPGLEEIKNDPGLLKIAVNKARLSIPVYIDNDILKPSTVSSQIYLTYRLRDTSYFVPDYNISADFFDGSLDTINKV